MFELFNIPFDIQLFAEGGDGGAGGEGTTGVQAADAGQQEPASEPKKDRNAEFEELIRGDYRDQFESRVQNIVKNRLRANEDKVAKYDASAPMRQILGQKYGIDPNDTAALTAAIEADASYYAEEAAEMGLTPQQLRDWRKDQREKAALEAQIQSTADEEAARQIQARWEQEAEQTRTIYPDFDLRTELANPAFENLIKNNVNIQTAYEVIHKDEIITGAMAATAKQVEQKMANKIMAGSNRPREGALGGQSAVQVKSDVSKLTKADRAEILRRAQRGEHIVF